MIAAILATLLFFNDQPTWLPSSVDWSAMQGRITPNQLSAAYHIIDGYFARAFFASEGERGPWPTLSGISRRFAEYDRLQDINSTLRSYPIALTNTPAVLARDFTRWASSVDDDFFAPVPTFAWTQSPDLSPETWNPVCRPFDLTYDPYGIFPLQKNYINHFVPNAIRPFGSQSIASQLANLQYQDGIDLGWQTSIASLAESAYGENNIYSITNSTRRLPNSNYPAPARMLGLVDRLFTGLRPSIECNIVTNRYSYELYVVCTNRMVNVTYDLDAETATIAPFNPGSLSFVKHHDFWTNRVSSAFYRGNSLKYNRSALDGEYEPTITSESQSLPCSRSYDQPAFEDILTDIYENYGGDIEPNTPYPFYIGSILPYRHNNAFRIWLYNVNLANGSVVCEEYFEDYPIEISGTASVPYVLSSSIYRDMDLAQSDSSSLLNTNRCNAVYLAPGYYGWNFINSSSLTTLASAYTASSSSVTTNRYYRSRRVSNLTSQTSRFNELKYEYFDELSFLKNCDSELSTDPYEMLRFNASAFNSIRLQPITSGSIALEAGLTPAEGYRDIRGTFLYNDDIGKVQILSCNTNLHAGISASVNIGASVDPEHKHVILPDYFDFSAESFPYLISDTIFNLQPTIEELY